MRQFTAKFIHLMKPGYYWFVYPGQIPDILYISRDENRTRLNFPYPDMTFYGPIEKPNI